VPAASPGPRNFLLAANIFKNLQQARVLRQMTLNTEAQQVDAKFAAFDKIFDDERTRDEDGVNQELEQVIDDLIDSVAPRQEIVDFDNLKAARRRATAEERAIDNAEVKLAESFGKPETVIAKEVRAEDQIIDLRELNLENTVDNQIKQLLKGKAPGGTVHLGVFFGGFMAKTTGLCPGMTVQGSLEADVSIRGDQISGPAKLIGFEVLDPDTCQVIGRESSQSGSISGRLQRGTNPLAGSGSFTFQFPQQTSRFQWTGNVTRGGITNGQLFVNDQPVGQFELMKGSR
jgi:hypothetical protein